MKVLKLIAILGIILIIGACAKMEVAPPSISDNEINLGTIDPEGGGTGIYDGSSPTICALVAAYENLGAGVKVSRMNSLLKVYGAEEEISTITNAQLQILDALCPLFAELLNSESPLASEVYCLLNNNPFLITLVNYYCRAYDGDVSSDSDLAREIAEPLTSIRAAVEYDVTREIVSLTRLADPGDNLKAIICLIVSNLNSCSLLENFCEVSEEPLEPLEQLEPLEPLEPKGF